MKWINKLERKFGRFYIPDLMLYIVILSFVTFVFDYLFPTMNLLSYINFDRGLIMQGQVWRVISFIIEPFSTSPVWMLFAAYFYWLIGTKLTEYWGDFKFNVFYFAGFLGTVIAGFITGYASTEFLNMSIFLAFAAVFPDEQFLLFFFIPIKAKYLAYIDILFLVIMLIINPFGEKLAIIMSFVNVLLFFGKDIYDKISSYFRYRNTRRNFRRQIRK